MKRLLLALLLIPHVVFADPVTVQYYPNRIFRTSTTTIGSDALLDKQALANVAASQTDASVVAAVTGKKIRVVAIAFQPGGTATNVTFNSKPAGAGTAISPLFATGANGVVALPWNPSGWWETNSGEGLSVTTGTGSTVGIIVTYITY